ncbi:PAS domain S-box-containing protein [Mariniflexile fucanivorans]|uniref:histidine kinase n=1 Tax=Mariniflexile fucanivorans TaxID=264023 RepID=A0A4R1RJW3_9FLAO|nr:HAMP domain-containing sensor histidine kinase [Mariniflexile fucanivorans]TCL66080.1 PAS domain S-box-containing protein [Mariniflexile fucanivorans]
MEKIIADALDANLLPDIFNHAYHGIAIVGLDGKWLLVSKSLCDILGYSESELLKRSFDEITHKEDLKIDLRKLKKLLKGEIESYKMEKRYFKKNGNLVWAQLSVSLVKNKDNKPKYFISQVQDITERKQEEDEKEIIANVVKEQNERLLNFSRIITHNLRTHAGNLMTLLGFVEDEIEETKTNDSFEFLRQAVSNLQETVTHLTEIAKFSKYDTAELKALNLHDFAVNAIYNVSALAKNSNCIIENNIEDSLLVTGIEAYLDSIILNLLTNAIKYKADDRDCIIVLSAKLEGDFIVLSVKDNGLGLDLETHGNKLFSLYQTFHNNKDSRGVGLFITKNQVESLDGKIDVKSEVNKGSEFLVYLKNAQKKVLRNMKKKPT